MTTTKLEVGRELDALIAERVMGFVWRRPAEVRAGRVCYADLMPPDARPDGRIYVSAHDPLLAKCERDYGSVPNYSTDIAVAWRIVEHFAKQDILLMLEQCRDQQVQYGDDTGGDRVIAESRQWSVYFQDVVTRGAAGADTPEMAICLAALEAVDSPF